MTHDKPGTHETKRDLSWPMWIPYVMLLLMLAMSYSLWNIAEKHYQQQEQQLFKTKVAEAKSRIEMRLHNYEYTLHAGLAFMNASDDVNRADWQDFAKTLHTKHFYPGIQGIGYALMLKPAELKAFEKKMAQEYKGFGFFPAGERSEYSAIVYIEPQDARNKAALGYDMYSEPTRREAMQRARDLGVIAVSGGVKLVQEIDENMQQGILMYAPHYKRGAQTQTLAQRRDALLGYVYSPFRLRDLMTGTLQDFEGVDFELYDVSDAASGNLLYRSFDIAKEHAANLRASELIVVGGRDWRLDFRCTEELHLERANNEPLLFALFGLIISLLLFSFLYYLVRSRQKLNTINGELLASRQWLEALLQSSTDGIHVLNRRGELVAWSRSFLQMLGYSENEAAGRGILDWSTMHEAEGILSNEGHNFDEQKIINTLYRNTKGESIDVELAIRAFEIKGERYLYCSSRETAQRKKTENELLRLSQVIGQNPYPVIITDDEGCIEYINAVGVEQSGYSKEELLGKNMSIFNSGLHTEEFYQELWRTIKEERSVWKETIVDKMKNGELRDWLSTIFPLFDNKGRIVNFVSFKEDITERKIKDKLFMLQTRQAQMGEMLSMIAHQWRQPLATINAISGKIRMREIFQEKEEPVLVEDLCKIEEQSLYLSQTITDFRDLFHPDKPKEEIRLRTIIARAANLLDHSIKGYGITLEQGGDEEVRVLTYANEVLQVLITLIRNSIDAFVENEIKERRISLTAGRNEAFATISLSDNAGGIKAEALQKIFLPYFTTKSPAHGTGLGLYMSKMLIEEHCDGKIEVEVDGTSGTVFTLSLPLPKEPR